MAVALTSSQVIHQAPYLVQKVVASMDTSASVLAVTLLGPASGIAPDEVSCYASSDGTDVVTPHIEFDLPNNEMDFQVIVENSGTIGTWEYTIYLKWFSQKSGGVS
jgi:hypothetical protein